MRKLFTLVVVALTLVTLSSFANCRATYTINLYDESGHYLGSNMGVADGATCAGAMAIARQMAQAL